jgi:hypothetical protein
LRHSCSMLLLARKFCKDNMATCSLQLHAIAACCAQGI